MCTEFYIMACVSEDRLNSAGQDNLKHDMNPVIFFKAEMNFFYYNLNMTLVIVSGEVHFLLRVWQY